VKVYIVKRLGPLFILSLTLMGAADDPLPGVVAPQPTEAERQMRLAQSFAESGDFRRAIHLYSIVADNTPETEWGATATHKTALLLSTPRNSARNDSLALVWFRTTIARTRSTDERLQAEVSIALLDRLMLRVRDARRQRSIVDSLQMALRRQSVMILAQTRRLQDMEHEVVSAQEELRRFKEVDVTLSRSRLTR